MALAPKPAARGGAKTGDDDGREPNRPSELDEMTHAEMRSIYEDATRNLLFAKQRQWRVVEYFTLTALALTAMGGTIPFAPGLAHVVAYILLVAGLLTIITLLFLQSWQYREQGKLRDIGREGFSSLSARLLGVDGSVGRELHRYIILGVMVLFVLIISLICFRVLLDVKA